LCMKMSGLSLSFRRQHGLRGWRAES